VPEELPIARAVCELSLASTTNPLSSMPYCSQYSYNLLKLLILYIFIKLIFKLSKHNLFKLRLSHLFCKLSYSNSKY
jgi:hypothetical protein